MDLEIQTESGSEHLANPGSGVFQIRIRSPGSGTPAGYKHIYYPRELALQGKQATQYRHGGYERWQLRIQPGVN